MSTKLKASSSPDQDIKRVMYEGQPEAMRMYRSGYESYFNQTPLLKDDDPCLMKNINEAQTVIRSLGEKLSKEDWVLNENNPKNGEFNRTIIAMESPRVDKELGLVPGREFLVAKWGKGFTGPVHGHLAGFEHEYLLRGKVLVNTYFMPYEDRAVARFIEQKLFSKPGDIVTTYNKKGNQFFKRQDMIHNFEALELTASLHYNPEHSLDGMGNRFIVEHFDDHYEIEDRQVYKLTNPDMFNMSAGDVYLVRSKNVPEYGNHYMVVTNGIRIMKEHGLRPQEKVIPYKGNLLDQYDDDVVVLRLNSSATILFHQFHHMKF